MAELTYLIPVGETISTAWSKVKGSKGTIWAALIILILISIGLGILAAIIKSTVPAIHPVVQLIIQVFLFLIQMGVLYIGIQRAFDLPISFNMMFRTLQWPLAGKVIWLYVLEIILFIPFIIFMIIPGIIVAATTNNGEPAAAGIGILSVIFGLIGILGIIYLAVRISVAMAFVLDKQTGAWDAIKLSFKATRHNFWRLVALIILQILILAVSAIPLGIGLIWTLPFAYILYGVIYKNLSLNLQV